jgi:hypothetical protein
MKNDRFIQVIFSLANIGKSLHAVQIPKIAKIKIPDLQNCNSELPISPNDKYPFKQNLRVQLFIESFINFLSPQNLVSKNIILGAIRLPFPPRYAPMWGGQYGAPMLCRGAFYPPILCRPWKSIGSALGTTQHPPTPSASHRNPIPSPYPTSTLIPAH